MVSNYTLYLLETYKHLYYWQMILYCMSQLSEHRSIVKESQTGYRCCNRQLINLQTHCDRWYEINVSLDLTYICIACITTTTTPTWHEEKSCQSLWPTMSLSKFAFNTRRAYMCLKIVFVFTCVISFT